jgi:UDP-glucose 4-epimerase
MKVLVNGTEGSIGSNVSKSYSKKSFEVTRIDNSYRGKLLALARCREVMAFTSAFTEKNIVLVI